MHIYTHTYVDLYRCQTLLMFQKDFCDSKYEITLNVVLDVGWPERRLWMCQRRKLEHSILIASKPNR